MTLLLIILAAIFKAIADTVADHFDVSIFKKLNPKWWKKSESSKYVPLFKFWFIKTKYRLDAWHLSNSAMIVCVCLAWSFRKRLTDHRLEPIAAFIVSGILFIVFFNLFYNKILRKP